LLADINLDDVLDSGAGFIIEQNGVEFPVNGRLCSFEAFKTEQNYAHHKAVLVPKICQLSNYKTNQIFYGAGVEGEVDAGQTIAAFIAQVLNKAGMAETTDYKLNGDNTRLKREYVCQYNESDFDFISRLIENEGVFYYIEQSTSGEAIGFLKDPDYDDLPQPKLIFDVAAMSQTQDDCGFGWSCRKQRLPQTLVVRNYNAEEPSLDVSDTTTIDDKGQGNDYIYGKNVKTDTEASDLSQLRAEESIGRKTEFSGESSVTRLQAGHCSGLDQHPNIQCNKIEYLAIEVNHEGHGLGQSKSSNGQNALRSQYRPALKTQKLRITGTLLGRIDGELDSEYAQLDSEGRYKVSLPFDFHNENHPGGLASARVRMIQPLCRQKRQAY
jgi:type VI secretion system secreted protein VgrG